MPEPANAEKKQEKRKYQEGLREAGERVVLIDTGYEEILNALLV